MIKDYSVKHLHEAICKTLNQDIPQTISIQAFTWLTKTRFQSPVFVKEARQPHPILITVMEIFRSADEERRNEIRSYFRADVQG